MSGRQRLGTTQVSVHGGSGDSEHFGDVGDRDALAPERSGLRGVGVMDLARPPALAPLAGCLAPWADACGLEAVKKQFTRLTVACRCGR